MGNVIRSMYVTFSVLDLVFLYSIFILIIYIIISYISDASTDAGQTWILLSLITESSGVCCIECGDVYRKG